MSVHVSCNSHCCRSRLLCFLREQEGVTMVPQLSLCSAIVDMLALYECVCKPKSSVGKQYERQNERPLKRILAACTAWKNSLMSSGLRQPHDHNQTHDDDDDPLHTPSHDEHHPSSFRRWRQRSQRQNRRQGKEILGNLFRPDPPEQLPKLGCYPSQLWCSHS